MPGKIAKYVTVGTNNLDRAKKFYDQLFESLGARSFAPNERSYFYTLKDDDTVFAVFVPYDGNSATSGNGNMTGITLDTTEEVDEMYNMGMRLNLFSTLSISQLTLIKV